MTHTGKRRAGRPLKYLRPGKRVNIYLPEFQKTYLGSEGISQKIQELVNKNMEETARDRIDKMNFSQTQLDFIFYDWQNRNEHIEWLLTATKEEIKDWGNTTDWGIASES
jgi:hypothetical protein